MKRTTSIKIKAVLLLIVFSLNTVVGFTCSMGFNMGYNKSHHTEDVINVSVHVHADGKKHHHENEPKKIHADDSPSNQHDKKDTSKKDDCCSNEIMQFQQSDKNLAAKTGINMPALVAILTTYFGIAIFNTTQSPPKKYIASYFHPPPPDIRVAIRSFQI